MAKGEQLSLPWDVCDYDAGDDDDDADAHDDGDVVALEKLFQRRNWTVLVGMRSMVMRLMKKSGSQVVLQQLQLLPLLAALLLEPSCWLPRPIQAR